MRAGVTQAVRQPLHLDGGSVPGSKAKLGVSSLAINSSPKCSGSGTWQKGRRDGRKGKCLLPKRGPGVGDEL